MDSIRSVGRGLVRIPRGVRTIIGSLAIASCLLLGMQAPSASAAVPGLQLVSVTSPINSVAAKAATVTCPSGKFVVSAGGQINTSATGRVALDEITPLPNM